MSFPHSLGFLEPEQNKKLSQYFPMQNQPFVKCNNYIFNNDYVGDSKNIFSAKIRPQDVWIVTLPRSGTTLTQELIWLICNNADVETASTESLHERWRFLEGHMLLPEKYFQHVEAIHGKEVAGKIKKIALRPGWEGINETKEKLFIKSHMPLSLLPANLLQTSKVIYVVRNPKDMITSYFYFCKSYKNLHFDGDFDDFLELFINNEMFYANYWEHISEALKERDHKNVLVLFYEEINEDKKGQIQRISDFLNVRLTDEMVDEIFDYTSVTNFKNNHSVYEPEMLRKKEDSIFIRRGVVNSFEDLFSDEQIRRTDKWIEENCKKYGYNEDILTYFLSKNK